MIIEGKRLVGSNKRFQSLKGRQETHDIIFLNEASPFASIFFLVKKHKLLECGGGESIIILYFPALSVLSGHV